MTHLILNPPREDVAKFGTLAYVTPEERARILALPFGETPRAIKNLERDLRDARKRRGGGAGCMALNDARALAGGFAP